MNPESFRTYAHRVSDWIADYRRDLEQRSVVPDVKPGEIRARLPIAAPESGEPLDAILEDFERIIVPGVTHWQHPGWFAYFPGNSSLPSVLAEMLTAGLAAQCMSWQTSPAATELEEVTLEWLRRLLGLPEGFTGVIQDTASTSTLTAVITARDEAWRRFGRDAPLTLYASEEAHSSIFKAARLAGFPDDRVRRIPTDETYALVPDALRDALDRDRRGGLVPACVVATVGTTSSTGLDPVRPIGELCRDAGGSGGGGAFLHVDAAYAGSAAVAPEFRGMLDGVELADSFVVNPHKWLLTNLDCSAYYVRDPDALRRSFALTPEYLRTAADQQVVNYRDWGIPLGRRFRALKLWFVLRSYGAEGLRRVIRDHVRLARAFASWVDADPEFERVAPVPLGLVCFRHRPPGLEGVALDGHNERLLARVNASGRVYLTHTVLGGRYVIRLVVGQETTTERHVREAWDLIRAAAFAD